MQDLMETIQSHQQQIQQGLSRLQNIPPPEHKEVVKVIDDYTDKYHMCKKCNQKLHYSFFTMQKVVRKDKDDKTKNVIKLIPYGYCKSCASQYHKDRRKRLKASGTSHPLYLVYTGNPDCMWVPANDLYQQG